MPAKGNYPFGAPKMKGPSTMARKVQGTSGHAKPMNKMAAPSKGAPSMAVKIAERGTTRPAVTKTGSRAGNDATSKPNRVRPL